MKVGIVMGSKSDYPVVQKAEQMLENFGVEYETRIISAHRTPKQAEQFAADAEANGFGCIIAAAGKAAHLAGVLAATTPLPVIGIPMKSSTMDGLDSLLSVVQMPKGVPVATVAIDGAENAALLAVQILSTADPALREAIKAFKKKQEEQISDRETIVKAVKILPLEVITRNISAGSFAKRYGVEEGIVFDKPTFELSYKNDDLGDPLMCESHALALKLVTEEQLEKVKAYTATVNETLKEFFLDKGLKLVDFKIEFGLYDGEVILADEISPDTCRLWDVETNEKMDKDRFRRDLGKIEETYAEVLRRVKND